MTVVAGCLAAFSLGLVFNGWMLMLTRGFYGLQSNWLPTAIGVATLVLNAVLDVALYPVGVWGIPLATSLVNIVGVALLVYFLWRRVGDVHLRRVAGRDRAHQRRGGVLGCGCVRGLVPARPRPRTLGGGAGRVPRSGSRRGCGRVPRRLPGASRSRARGAARARLAESPVGRVAALPPAVAAPAGARSEFPGGCGPPLSG